MTTPARQRSLFRYLAVGLAVALGAVCSATVGLVVKHRRPPAARAAVATEEQDGRRWSALPSRREGEAVGALLRAARASAAAAGEDEPILRAHDAEPVDTAWAAGVTETLSQSLEGLGRERKFDVRQIDCRSQTCVAELEWPSRDAALAGYRAPLAGMLGVTCGTQIVLPPSEDPSGVSRAKMFLRCRR